MEIRACRITQLRSWPTLLLAMSERTIAHPFENPKRPHLEPAELESFLRGELGRPETRRVVRHLLTKCPQCVAVAHPVWGSSSR